MKPGWLHSRSKRSCLRLFAAASSLLAACTPFDTKLDSWNGHPIQEWLAIPDKGGEHVIEIRGPDAAGQLVYVIAVSKDCTVFWTVDEAGIIVSWKHDGAACKHYWQ